MRFTTDDDELSITLELEADEAAGVDLTKDELGSKILAAAVDEMIDSARREETPEGSAWPELAPATKTDRYRKGFSTIGTGYRTGAMLAGLDLGTDDVGPRSCTWRYPNIARREVMAVFHNGNDVQPPRGVIGWTADAEAEARRLIDDAQAEAEELEP